MRFKFYTLACLSLLMVARASAQTGGALTFMVDPTGNNGQAGDLQLVRISNTVRYTNTFTPSLSYASDGQTVAFWPMTDGGGQTASDLSGHGYHASLGPASGVTPSWIPVGTVRWRIKSGSVSPASNGSGASGGSGYLQGDVVTVVGGTPATAATLTVNAVDGNGTVTSIGISNGGDYSEALATGVYDITGGTGMGGQVYLQQDDCWESFASSYAGLRFDGSNYGVANNGSSQFDLGTGTYELWFRGTTAGSDTRLLATYSGTGTGFFIGLLGGGTGLRFCLWGPGSTYLSLKQTSATNLLNGSWHHVAVTLAGQGSAAKLWVDGRLEATTNEGGASTLPTLLQSIPAATMGAGAGAAALDLRPYFGLPGVIGPVAYFNTVMGQFTVELLPSTAPRHVTNFMTYANGGYYSNTFFHRSVSFEAGGNSIVQGGGFGLAYDQYGNAQMGTVVTNAAVALEYNLPNARGTLAAARTSNSNSATSQWFFNVRDNSSNLGPNLPYSEGYTAFGRVLGTGMSVVDAIAALPTYNLGEPLDTLPLRNVQTNQSGILIENLIMVSRVSMIPVYPDGATAGALRFTASSSNPSVATVGISGSALIVNPLTIGSATVTVQALDVNSNVVSGTMAVSVVSPKAQMVTPTSGSTLTNAPTTFTWSAGTGAAGYAIWIGNTQGTYDIYAAIESGLSRTLTLPEDGRNLYVRLWTLVGQTWQYTDYTYKAQSPIKATLLSPASGSTNSSASVTFSWNRGAGVSQYALWVGSASGGYDLYAQVIGTNLSQTVTLPVDGRTLYVRLYSLIGGNWQSNDYSCRAYTAFGVVSNSSLPAGALNGSYNQTLQVQGGTGPYTWSWSGGTPPGMNLSSGGVLSGTPTAIGTYNFTVRVVDAQPATNTQAASLVVCGQDLGYATVMKSQLYWQTNAGAAALPPPSLESTPFEFVACAKQTTTGTINSATVRLPDTTVQSLVSSPSPYSDWVWRAGYATKSALDAAFTNGLYTLTIGAAHDGTNALPVNMPGDSYPTNAPHISNWSAAQAVNPAANFTLTWDALAGGTTNDFVTVEIRDRAGTNLFFASPAWGRPGALNGTNASVVIPGATLATNQTYRADVGWWRFGAQNNTNYPGAMGGSLYGRKTALLLATTAPAQMLSPTNNSVFTTNSVAFSWSTGAGVGQYAIWMGTNTADYSLYAALEPTNSRTLSVPVTGAQLYLRLWSFINGEWQFNDYTYRAPSPVKAAIVSPLNGSTHSSASVTFSWNPGLGVSQRALWVGNSAGAYDLYAAFETGASRAVTLPTDGRQIYVRLWSSINGTWDYNDYTYKAFTTVKAKLGGGLLNGATLGASTVNFTWDSGAGATQYRLTAGSSSGWTDLYNGAATTNLSQSVTLPSDGRQLYVTLWSLINASWSSNIYEFGAYNTASSRAAMLSPTNGAVLAANPVTFTWNAGTNVTQYALWADSTPGTYGLAANVLGTNRSCSLTLPIDGNPICVRLWSLISGAWECNDYVYQTALPGGAVKAAMITPANGAALPSASPAFTWTSGTNVTEYALWAGSALGTYDLYAAMAGTNLTKTVTGLPSDGGPIYVRLWSSVSGAWKFSDYFYTAYLAP